MKLWFSLLVLLSWPFSTSAQNKIFTVYLDPGHGGSEFGAIAEGVVEAPLMLQFSRELKQAFTQHTNFQIHVSRTADQTKTLAERVADAHAQKADLFLSLHANSAHSSKARGIEIFFRAPQPSQPDTASLEQMIADLKELGRQQTSIALSKNLKTELRQNQLEQKPLPVRIKQAPFYVLAKTQIPALLVEVGFLTNPRERQKLQQKKYRQQIAEEIVMAVQNFVGSRPLHKDFSDKTSAPILN